MAGKKLIIRFNERKSAPIRGPAYPDPARSKRRVEWRLEEDDTANPLTPPRAAWRISEPFICSREWHALDCRSKVVVRWVTGGTCADVLLTHQTLTHAHIRNYPLRCSH